MVVLNLVIILVISKNLKINGFNSMIKELGSLILTIFSSIALEDNTGGEKVKVLIFLSIRRLSRNLSDYNLEMSKNRRISCRNLT